MKILLLILVFTPFLLFSQEDTTVVLYPDQEAEFPGGAAKMMKYISKNIQYPEIEFETVPDGRIFIEFIINKDGSIEQVKARKEGIKELDEEYIRVIKNMPNWIPAQVNGEKVISRVILPIRIHLQ